MESTEPKGKESGSLKRQRRVFRLMPLYLPQEIPSRHENTWEEYEFSFKIWPRADVVPCPTNCQREREDREPCKDRLHRDPFHLRALPLFAEDAGEENRKGN